MFRENPIEGYLVMSANTIHDKIKTRIAKYAEEYNLVIGHMRMAWTTRRNVRTDLAYMRDTYINVHKQLRKEHKITREFYALDRMSELLENVESMGMMQLLKLHDPWFGVSKAERKRRDMEMVKLVKEILEEENLKLKS